MMDWWRSALLIIHTILSSLPVLNPQSLPDNRCYLENGASSENFFVSEDSPIGSIIGQVRIHGDPRPGGTIALRLREPDSPIAIISSSRNLTLRRALDKEGISGPSSVFINLICERLHTVDPGFVIPINIRVTDANDNAPKFINAPYALNISEVTVVGTRVLQGVHAVDDDQQGPFSSVRYSVLPGMYANYFDFENELEGTLVLRKPLDYESLRTFDVGIRAQDHGDPPKSSDTTLTVYVVDADDQNPRFLDDRYSATLLEPPLKSTPLDIKPRDIKAFDQDIGINAAVFYTFNGVGTDYSYFKINRHTAKVALAKDLAQHDLQHPATLVIRATQQDNPDRYALATLTVTRNGGNSIRFLRPVYNIKAPESLPVGTTLTILASNRHEPLKYFVSDKDVLDVFAINPKGELALRQQLDYEKRAEYTFRVFATDGVTNDSSVVNVSVEDVNEWEPQFRYSHYEFFVSGRPEELIGRIEVGDGDLNDEITLTLAGANASQFSIAPNGELKINDLSERFGIAKLMVIASDNGNPPRKATVPVIVHFNRKGSIADELLAGSSIPNGMLLLGGFGAILLLLAIVIAILIVYICKAKRSGNDGQLQDGSEKQGPDKVSNPVFGDVLRSPTASALGGVPNSANSKSKPSPKVHPAPQPPLWPHSAMSNRVKKLSWGDDKIDGEINTENTFEAPQRLNDNTNLTVYF
ncbi:hypothetical protein PPYR_08960 [Photinus pyralis]|uniref:Cadherin domain-containing protein n=1 Tax=Photinus pyralis TaxID=7054 RepID=A0A5N4AKW8_PHOPY|nr:cadherin EGF LAG seven-pass G-type receptor 2-like [Photinus pyralis]KAB0797967.1 hypothetical protein PPYR_08960 [Photinus pyralis]